MTSIADRPEYNPCPKCGDDTLSRRAKFRFDLENREVLDITCVACGARLATVRPLDDREAPGAAA